MSSMSHAPPTDNTAPETLLIASLWRASRPLTAAGIALLGFAAVTIVGIIIDERTITGAPAWLKPFKFAISTAVYSLTLA